MTNQTHSAFLAKLMKFHFKMIDYMRMLVDLILLISP